MARIAGKRHGRRKLTRLAIAMTPALIATTLVALSLAWRVTTPIQLEVLVRSVTLTIAGRTGKTVPLLNNLTEFSTLVVDECDTVSFPPLSIDLDGRSTPASPSHLSFRCDPRVPGSKVLIHPLAETAGDTALELGSVGPITAQEGDRVGLDLTSKSPPEIRVQVARPVPFSFSLNKDTPFEIDAEFAEAGGLADPVDPDGVKTYRASLSSPLRMADVTSRGNLNIVIGLAGRAGAAETFRQDVDIPIESISLFERSDVDDAFVSTALDGKLTYAGRPDVERVSIRAGEHIRLKSARGFRLTQLRLDRTNPGLWFQLEGNASELTTSTTDRRLRLFDRVVTDRSRALVGVIAAIAAQVMWLRRYL